MSEGEGAGKEGEGVRDRRKKHGNSFPFHLYSLNTGGQEH